MAESLGQAVLELTTDDTRLDAGLARARQGAERLGSRFKAIGSKASLYLTAPIAGLAATTLKLADAQAQAERQLAASLEASGGAVEERLAGFKEFASQLQRITTVGDETTLQNLQVAKSMGLTDAQAKSAAQNAVALAKAFGINESSAIRYTAALEQGDTTMLNRYIPTLRGLEDDSARVAEAQRILADAFKLAETEANTGLGPLKQLSNSLGDLGEQFGVAILPAVQKFAELAAGLVDWLQQLDAPTKQWLAALAAGLAVGGPILLGLGLVVTGIGALLSPIGLVVAAIVGVGGLIAAFVTFREDIVNYVTETVAEIKQQLIGRFTAIVDGVKEKVDKVIGFFGDLWDKVVGHSFVPDMIDEIQRQFGRLDTGMVPIAERATDRTKNAFEKMADGVGGALGGMARDLARGEVNFENFGSRAMGILQTVADNLLKTAVADPLSAGLSDVASGLGSWLGNMFGGGSSFAANRAAWLTPTSALGASFYHGGGVAGREGARAPVAASLFTNAPRFHNGTLRAGEMAAILRRDEGVFTPEQMKALGPAGGTYFIDATGADSAAIGRLEQTITALNGSIERRSIAAVVQARRRDPSLFGFSRAG